MIDFSFSFNPIFSTKTFFFFVFASSFQFLDLYFESQHFIILALDYQSIICIGLSAFSCETNLPKILLSSPLLKTPVSLMSIIWFLGHCIICASPTYSILFLWIPHTYSLINVCLHRGYQVQWCPALTTSSVPSLVPSSLPVTISCICEFAQLYAGTAQGNLQPIVWARNQCNVPQVSHPSSGGRMVLKCFPHGI